MNDKLLFSALMLAGVMSACSGGGSGDDPEPTPTPVPPSADKVLIKINSSVTSLTDSRATDDAFEQGDKAGLFVVNRNADGSAASLAASGNHVNNQMFSYDGSWTSSSPIYWKDETTHADFYLYYPYTSTVTSTTAMPFSVNANQSAEADYKASDLLVGSAHDVAPTESAVGINVSHVMSQMVITLAPGDGFTDETLSAANVRVAINGVKTSATVNLADGSVTATGDASTVTPLNTDGKYKAIIVPQSVEETNLVTVKMGRKSYNLQKAFTFESGKRHSFTVTVSKTSNGLNVKITGWDDDDTDNGGTAE